MWLLEHGASPDVPDGRGWTAMHQAASRGNVKMMQALIDAGGDQTIKDADGQTPRDVAHNMAREKIEKLLPRHAANRH
jgi:ankyrin repeat protein